MKKMRFVLAAALALAFTVSAAACSDNTGNTGGGSGGTGDTYQDYTPDKQPGDGQFDFDGNYQAPELTIDGLGDDEQWQGVDDLVTYGKQADGSDAVSVKVYRGESALFFLFEVKDSVLLTQGVTNDDAVTRGDSIELYIDTLADGGRSPQSDDYQLNLGIHSKTRIMQGAGGLWGNWNGLIDYEVSLDGTLNDGDTADDTGYSVEVMIPYAQIMIEKDDTIGIAFGQVDKIRTEDAATGSETSSWNWYGWSYGGTSVNPQVPDQYILLDKDNKLMSRDEQPKAPADIAGNVVDQNGDPVADAQVTAVSGDVRHTATTNASGYFVIEDVDPELTYTVTVAKDGYLSGQASYTRAELRAADGGIVIKDFTLAATSDLETTTVTGTVKNVAYGAVENATVSVQGTLLTATTNASGEFTISGVPSNNGDVTLTVSCANYADSQTVIAEGDLVTDGTTALGDVNISLPASVTGSFGSVTGLASNSGEISRALDGVVIEFSGERTFNGWIELYFDTKESGKTRNSTDVQYQLRADGTVTAVNYGGNFTTDGIEWTVNRIEDGGYTARFFIPYTTLGIGALEPFGISLGQNNGAGVWDGWGRDDMIGTNGIGFVAPEIPSDYVRVNALNGLYEAANNNKTATFSGSTGVAGITVSANGVSTVSGQGGSWSMVVPVSDEAITVTYSGQGYVQRQTTIEAGYFSGIASSWSENVTMEARRITVTGTVTDQDGTPVEGVEVELVYLNGGSVTATTDRSGQYTLENVTAFADVTITFTKEGYAQGTEQRTAAQLAAADSSLTINKQITASAQIRNITVSGKVVGINGGIANATVRAGDLSATTGPDGSFEIEDFPVVDTTITIEADGYLSSSISFRAADYTDDEQVTLSDAFLALEYEALGGAFGIKSDSFASFVPYVTRGESAFLFRFEGSAPFTGNVEFFLDTGLSSGEGGRNATDYRFDLYADGSVRVDNFGGSNTGIDTLRYNVTGADGDSPVLTFEIPYTFLGVQRDEIVGVTFGQSIVSDWDGWIADGITGVDGLEFVQPERTWDYMRIGADNKPFWNAENAALSELDLTGYNLHFGKGANDDSFHAKVVSRDGEGITFEFVTLGDFGTRSEGTETLLLYIDTGDPAAGWAVDHQYKLVSDGNAYKNLDSDDDSRVDGNAWWAADDAHKLGTFAITRENGVTKFTYKVLYSDIGASADDVIGFAILEGWLTGDNGSNEYGNGMLYSYADGCHVVADAANTAGYVRIKADGSLAVAGSNSEVTD